MRWRNTGYHRAAVATAAIALGILASAQEPQSGAAEFAKRVFDAIPSDQPANVASLEGQQYTQALPAAGREDMRQTLEGLSLASRCEAVAEPTASITEHLLGLARATRIVIINEAHDVPRHREFTRTIIPLLRESGYTHFAAEAFSARIGDYPGEAFGRIDAGSTYVSEPTFGRLIRTAKALGYELVSYEAAAPPPAAREASLSEQVAYREEGQARNLVERIFEQNDQARVIIHVGYSHAAEVPIPSFDQAEMAWMAARLKEKTGIDPLTIDQTYCESPDERMRLAYPAGRMPPGAFDLSIAHPRTTFEQKRPTWRLAAGTMLVDLPAAVTEKAARVVVEARFVDEPPEAIPVDRLLLWRGEAIPLVLPPGEFRVTAFEEGSPQHEEFIIAVDE